jgi:hypothetical protein
LPPLFSIAAWHLSLESVEANDEFFVSVFMLQNGYSPKTLCRTDAATGLRSVDGNGRAAADYLRASRFWNCFTAVSVRERSLGTGCLNAL